jgi:prepilin-type N-terminal cleavage/methylation domain-containing protein/prepilin-type processing-associated H-X9-DG protein
MYRKTGFTLIEILVVIGLISILAGFVLPVFAHAREEARKATCLSNQKQLGLAYMLYVDDNDDTFPLNTQAPNRRGEVYYSPPNLVLTKSSPQEQAWYRSQGANVVYPYTKSYKIWACPSGELAEAIPGDPAYKNLRPGVEPTEISYSFNGLLGSLTRSEIVRTAYVVLMWEPGRFRWVGAAHVNPGVHTNPIWSPASAWPYRLPDCIASTGFTSTGVKGSWFMMKGLRPETHNGGQNWVYADGHAKWRAIGGNTMSTDPNKDPFRYNPDGTIAQAWTDECKRMWLFRNDYDPDLRAPGRVGNV